MPSLYPFQHFLPFCKYLSFFSWMYHIFLHNSRSILVYKITKVVIMFEIMYMCRDGHIRCPPDPYIGQNVRLTKNILVIVRPYIPKAPMQNPQIMRCNSFQYHSRFTYITSGILCVPHIWKFSHAQCVQSSQPIIPRKACLASRIKIQIFLPSLRLVFH